MASILLIDDEDIIRDVAVRILTQAGHDVVAVDDGTRAIAQPATAGGFNLIITDLVMPGLSGPTLIAALRDRHPGVPVIAMSGTLLAAALPPQTVQHLGITRLLPKPFGVDDLIATVRDVLGPPA